MNQFQALVIDDEPQVREFVSTILTNDGWQVAQSESAEEAFKMLNDEAWSVVFCDVMRAARTDTQCSAGSRKSCRKRKLF